MTKQCPECKRQLEFNECNFICGCDGYWRGKCRDCQNRCKRRRYKKNKKNKTKKPNPYKIARQQRLQAMIEKYDEVFRVLDEYGVKINAPSDYVDRILESAKILNRKSA